ncbi:hypothetical protein ZOSMA_3G02130 [Zostera marina]|uniref:Uncharacterized protein n=1 Tax=Zostera marina TaxID=29655 RepID=A0A0K9P415_ZOSMR|nr:hypothetical protein ZOSMA_3G02130 [Zostera marina]
MTIAIIWMQTTFRVCQTTIYIKATFRRLAELGRWFVTFETTGAYSPTSSACRVGTTTEITRIVPRKRYTMLEFNMFKKKK